MLLTKGKKIELVNKLNENWRKKNLKYDNNITLVYFFYRIKMKTEKKLKIMFQLNTQQINNKIRKL